VIAAANRGDIDGFHAGFMPDGMVDDWGASSSGVKAIRGWSDHELIGVQVGLTINSVTIGDKVVSVQADVGGGGFNGPSTL
jgi:hypothetical protein